MSSSPPASPTLSQRRLSDSSSSSASKDKPHHLLQNMSDAQEPIQIHVKTPSGATSTLTVPPTTSIATLKSLVALQQQPHLHENAYPSANQRLLFAGRHMDEPEKTLRDYYVAPGSEIDLVLPLRGGGAEFDSSAEPPTEAKVQDAIAPSARSANESNATPNVTKPVPTAEGPVSSSQPPAKTKSSSGGMKKKGPRCAAANCNALAQRIVGECGFCGGLFCGKHRLLESHSCEGLEKAKAEDKERNKDKLEGERTVVRGVVGI